jgi:hypothetical protein
MNIGYIYHRDIRRALSNGLLGHPEPDVISGWHLTNVRFQNLNALTFLFAKHIFLWAKGPADIG